MPMSSGGYAANSSGCATRPKAREIGSTEYAGPTQHSLLIGCYVMAMAEHREPCDSRGSCTVLGAPGGEIPPGDSTNLSSQRIMAYSSLANGARSQWTALSRPQDASEHGLVTALTLAAMGRFRTARSVADPRRSTACAARRGSWPVPLRPHTGHCVRQS